MEGETIKRLTLAGLLVSLASPVGASSVFRGRFELYISCSQLEVFVGLQLHDPDTEINETELSLPPDEYELYLKGLLFGFGHEEDRFSPEGAAEHLWLEFLQHAGISYD